MIHSYVERDAQSYMAHWLSIHTGLQGMPTIRYPSNSYAFPDNGILKLSASNQTDQVTAVREAMAATGNKQKHNANQNRHQVFCVPALGWVTQRFETHYLPPTWKVRNLFSLYTVWHEKWVIVDIIISRGKFLISIIWLCTASLPNRYLWIVPARICRSVIVGHTYICIATVTTDCPSILRNVPINTTFATMTCYPRIF